MSNWKCPACGRTIAETIYRKELDGDVPCPCGHPIQSYTEVDLSKKPEGNTMLLSTNDTVEQDIFRNSDPLEYRERMNTPVQQTFGASTKPHTDASARIAPRSTGDQTYHNVAVDIAKRIHQLEMRYDLQEGREPAFTGMVNKTERDFAHGQWKALKDLQWRMNNPQFLGTDV